MTEYEDRLAKAYAAQTYGDLARLSADLPGTATPLHPARPVRPAPSTLLLAIMSGFERRGRWNVPKRLTSVAVFGGGVIDLRYADFTSPDVEIHSYSIFGGQTILLPPEVNVERPRRRRDGRVRSRQSELRLARAHRASPSVASHCGAASASSARSAGPSPSRSTQP